ncbi:oncoprotein-induced transcript 3 protein-like [Argopecten irradians]|uniref:oncoprotein-induced transcript 3 protein-like n=1 Tax=Argopecten irradians TaxID=31199 RepID=UPI003711131C
MKRKVMKLVVFASIVCIIDKVAGEPCVTYTNFTADSERSPNHTESKYTNKICDVVLSTKWYRLVGEAGSDLTNDSSVLIDDGCGTSYQRWMNGTIPDVSEGAVDRQICMRSIFSICHSSFTIKVKNCCSFRVYQLKSATNCPQAYCVSPSLVPSDNCSHIVWTTTTVTTTSTTTTTTTSTTTTTTTTNPAITTNTAGVTNVLDDNENKTNAIPIAAIVVLGLIITLAVVGICIVYRKGVLSMKDISTVVRNAVKPSDRYHY